MKIRSLTKLSTVAAIIVLIVGISACDQLQQLLPPPEMEGPGEIVIGVSLQLEGEDATRYGLPMKRGFELAQEEINQRGGPQLTFIFEDDQSTVEGALAAFNKLIHQDGVFHYHRCHVSRLNSAS